MTKPTFNIQLWEILKEIQHQVEDGYAQPVNGWTTILSQAETDIKELIESTVRLLEPKEYPDYAIGTVHAYKLALKHVIELLVESEGVSHD